MVSDIVVVYTMQGQIIGEVATEEYESKDVRLKNPAMIVPNGNGVQFVPLANFVEDSEFTVSASAMLFQGTYKPVLPILNKYNEIFGSGIQIARTV